MHLCRIYILKWFSAVKRDDFIVSKNHNTLLTVVCCSTAGVSFLSLHPLVAHKHTHTVRKYMTTHRHHLVFLQQELTGAMCMDVQNNFAECSVNRNTKH